MNLDRKGMRSAIILMLVAGAIVGVVLNIGSFFSGVSKVLSLLNPLIIGFIMAFVLNILLKKVEGLLYRLPAPKEGSRMAGAFPAFCRVLGIIISILLLAALIVLVIGLLVPAIKEAWSMLLAEFPGYWTHLQEIAGDISARYGLEELTLPDLSVNYEKVVDLLEQFFTTGFSSAMGFMTSLVSAITNMLLGFVFAIYILAGKEKMGAQTVRVVKAYTSEKVSDEIFYIAGEANRIFSKFIIGQVADATILGCMCFVGMLIFSFPYAGMIAVLIGFTALIPIFGAFIGTAIGAFLILMVSPVKAFWFIIMVVVLQQVDGQLVYPRVVGSSVGLPAIWTLLAVLAGGSAGGLMGMLFGVPLVGLVYALIRRSVDGRLAKKGVE